MGTREKFTIGLIVGFFVNFIVLGPIAFLSSILGIALGWMVRDFLE